MEKLNIGIVGLNFGRGGIIESQLLKGPGSAYFNLAAVCDFDREKCSRLAAEYGVKAYFDIESLAADADIPVVGLFTGPVGRAKQIRRLIAAGKDVMTTKPFEIDHVEGLAVLKEAKALGRVVHLNSPAPVVDGGLKQIREWVAEYNLGRPIACRCDDWVSYREKPGGTWYDDPDLCPAAPVYRLGIYPINDLYRIFGEADKVHVMQSRIFTGRPTSDNAQVGILFKNGAIANVFASFCVKDGQHYGNPFVLNYENGTIYRNIGPLERAAGHETGPEMTLVMAGDGEKNRIIRKRAKIASGDYRWDVLYEAVRGNPPEDEITPEGVVHGVKIIDALLRSQKSGRTEDVG